jgi:hypothetical protein
MGHPDEGPAGTVVSTTLQGPLDWPDATVVSGDAVDVVARLKEESAVPLRSHGSLSMSRALMAAGLVDRVQVTLFPVIIGQTGVDPTFQGAADFDLELIESRTLDGHTAVVPATPRRRHLGPLLRARAVRGPARHSHRARDRAPVSLLQPARLVRHGLGPAPRRHPLLPHRPHPARRGATHHIPATPARPVRSRR